MHPPPIHGIKKGCDLSDRRRDWSRGSDLSAPPSFGSIIYVFECIGSTAVELGEMDKFDVVVVGGGIMGSCTAYEVAKRGRTVLLLEQFDFLHHLGSSHGESRTIRATYPEAFYTSMVLKSHLLWERAQQEAGYRVHTPTPIFDIGPSDSRSLQRVLANCESASIPVRVLGPGDVADAFSGVFTLPEGWIGVVTEIGGVIKPTKAVAMFQSLAMKRGAVLKDHVQVTGISMDEEHDSVRVSTANGTTFRGAKCVVTAGAWTKKLMEAVTGKALPILPIQAAAFYWKIKKPHGKLFAPESGFPSFSCYAEPYIYGTPSMEFPGLVKIALIGGEPCDPDEREWEAGVDLMQRKVRSRIEQVMPGYLETEKPVATESCMYSMTPDGDFVIDYVGGEFGKDLVVVGGFSGHGFKMGPLVGSVAAGMVIGGGEEGVEMSHFRLQRFVDGSHPMGNAKDYEEPNLFHGGSTRPKLFQGCSTRSLV